MITYVTPTGDVKEIELAQLLEQKPYTLLYFYPKNDTPGCTLEAQDFTALGDKFGSKDIQIVGVSKDTVESHCKFKEKYSLSPAYIADPELDLHKTYATRGEKNNYGKIVMGVIRSTFLLDHTGNIVQERRSIRATGHAQRVLTWVEENL